MRENIEGRKRGVALLKSLSEAAKSEPDRAVRGGWEIGLKRDLAWYKFKRSDPAPPIGEAISAIAAKLDECGADYQCGGTAHASFDGYRYARFDFAIYFNPAEMLADEDLKPAARELGLVEP